MRLGLRFVKDVGAEAARRMVEEREEHGSYAGAGDLVRRTGLKPQAVLSLAMAGAFDALTPNRRAALWDAGLSIRPSGNGQRAFPRPRRPAPRTSPTSLPTSGWWASTGSWVSTPGASHGVRAAHAEPLGAAHRRRGGGR